MQGCNSEFPGCVHSKFETPISCQAKKRPVIVSAELLVAVATWRDSHENFVLQWVVSYIRELSEESSALECLFLKHAIV